jgi:hypothetical protein
VVVPAIAVLLGAVVGFTLSGDWAAEDAGSVSGMRSTGTSISLPMSWLRKSCASFG